MSEVFDYQQCIDAFMDSLAQLHGHIAEHSMHVCSDDDAAQIAIALGMLAVACEEEFTDEEREALGYNRDWILTRTLPESTPERRQLFETANARWEREWNEAWDYLRDNLRKWWC